MYPYTKLPLPLPPPSNLKNVRVARTNGTDYPLLVRRDQISVLSSVRCGMKVVGGGGGSFAYSLLTTTTVMSSSFDS